LLFSSACDGAVKASRREQQRAFGARTAARRNSQCEIAAEGSAAWSRSL